MGILTDILIADHGEAEQLAAALNPTETWEGIDAKGLDSVKLGVLYSLLSGCEVEETYAMFAMLEGEEEGPWVQAMPADFPRLLTSMTDQDAIAREWAQAEEFALDGWAPEAVADVLSQLERLAARAQELDRPLVLWMSL